MKTTVASQARRLTQHVYAAPFAGAGTSLYLFEPRCSHLLFSKKCPEKMSVFTFCYFISYFKQFFAKLPGSLFVRA